MVGDNNIQLNAIGIEMFGPRAVSSVERSTVEPPNKGHFAWERAFCPLFGGCPYLGGLPLFDFIAFFNDV